MSDDRCVCSVEESYCSGVELQDQAFLGIDADAISDEFVAVEDKADSVAELDAQFPPLLDYLRAVGAGDFELAVEAGEESFCK